MILADGRIMAKKRINFFNIAGNGQQEFRILARHPQFS